MNKYIPERSKKFSPLEKFVFSSILIVMICIIVITIHGYFYPITPPKLELSLLNCKNEILLLSKAYEQRELLSKIILEHQSSYSGSLLAYNNQRIQTNLSFIAFIAVLLIPFLTNKRKYYKEIISALIIVLTIAFYLFDVHTRDYQIRAESAKILIDNTIIELNLIHPNDTRWYFMNYENYYNIESDKRKNSLCRKLKDSLRPDLSQIVFYFFPTFMFLLLYLVLKIIDKKKNSIY